MALKGIDKVTRRDQMTILSDLLHILQEPTKLTHLLYRSGMSYTQLMKYLKYLLELGMVLQKQKPFRAYEITPNGKVFLELMSKSSKNGPQDFFKFANQ